jgi:pyruvyltransferase
MNIYNYRPRSGQNFGDELGPVIVNSILNNLKLKNSINDNLTLFTVGSVIHLSRHNDVVWGSGVNGKVSLPINMISRNYYAVRGPRTQNLLLENGIKCPKNYGDPAILLSDIYAPKKNVYSSNQILIIPNYNDFSKLLNEYEKLKSKDMIIIHPFTHLYTLLDLIANSDAVITSSLHAKIIADCYQIPNAILGGNGYAEHPFKYLDYSEGIGHKNITFFSDISSSLKKISNPLIITKDIKEELLNAFPVKFFHAC